MEESIYTVVLLICSKYSALRTYNQLTITCIIHWNVSFIMCVCRKYKYFNQSKCYRYAHYSCSLKHFFFISPCQTSQNIPNI